MHRKEEILKLRSEGFSYGDIQKILGCSKGTISYHCGIGQKQKTKKRTLEYRTKDKLLFILRKRVSRFNNKIRTEKELKIINNKSTFKKNLYDKCFRFVNKDINIMKVTAKSILEKLQITDKCELTGRIIDIENTSSWHLDHIVPFSRGGSNTLDNCRIVCKEANVAKSDLLDEEFIQLCKDVLAHNGYKVEQLC